MLRLTRSALDPKGHPLLGLSVSGREPGRFALLASLVLLAPVIALAQPLEDGTYDVYNEDVTVEGRIEGCSLVFTGLVKDYAYLAGQQIVVNGSIAIRTLGSRDLLFTGKLGTRQLLPDGSPSGEWQAPTHFHVATKNGTTAGQNVKIIDAETPGYRLLLGRASEGNILKLVMDLPDTGEFVVGFNRKPGGRDVRLPIKINIALKKDASGAVTRVTNDDTLQAFAQCVNRVVSDLSSRLRNGK